MTNVLKMQKQKVKPVHTLVRLNDELSVIIRTSAEKNFRSLAREIAFRLTRDLVANPEDKSR